MAGEDRGSEGQDGSEDRDRQLKSARGRMYPVRKPKKKKHFITELERKIYKIWGIMKVRRAELGIARQTHPCTPRRDPCTAPLKWFRFDQKPHKSCQKHCSV